MNTGSRENPYPSCKTPSRSHANPSRSLLSVMRRVLLMLSAALPIANEMPLLANIGRSFSMSPMVAIASVEMPSRFDIAATKVLLS